ncbi:MAG: CGNR zinc finger domain-containing protein, partial [Actinomycetota bacterium]
LTWTLRYRTIAPTELLVRPGDLRRWISAAVAPVRGSVTSADRDDAIALREAVYAAARATIDGRTIAVADRRTINQWAARPGPVLHLDRRGRATTQLRPGAEVAGALAAVATDAVALLAAGDERLRLCSGPGCSLLFYDESRAGNRRWCSALRCGNRVNTAAYRRRSAVPANDH